MENIVKYAREIKVANTRIANVKRWKEILKATLFTNKAVDCNNFLYTNINKGQF